MGAAWRRTPRARAGGGPARASERTGATAPEAVASSTRGSGAGSAGQTAGPLTAPRGAAS
eukprot:4793231-Alexandrium_andersonii.AAC.1